MIRFALRCEPAGHDFDGWFRSGDDFDRQRERGLLECVVCGSAAVGKALMRPAVSGIGERVPATPTQVANAPQPGSEGAARMLHALQEMTRQVRREADYVGDGFAGEARRIHYGEAPERRIYGEASGSEVRSLLEEGITALPMAPLPEDKN